MRKFLFWGGFCVGLWFLLGIWAASSLGVGVRDWFLEIVEGISRGLVLSRVLVRGLGYEVLLRVGKRGGGVYGVIFGVLVLLRNRLLEVYVWIVFEI